MEHEGAIPVKSGVGRDMCTVGIFALDACSILSD